MKFFNFLLILLISTSAFGDDKPKHEKKGRGSSNSVYQRDLFPDFEVPVLELLPCDKECEVKRASDRVLARMNRHSLKSTPVHEKKGSVCTDRRLGVERQTEGGVCLGARIAPSRKKAVEVNVTW